MNRRTRISGLALVATLLLSACGASDAEENQRIDVVRAVTTLGGDYRVEYVPGPDPIPLNEPFGLTLTVTDTRGDALPGSPEVRVDGWMPGHGHGMNTTPEVLAVDEKTYAVEGMLFHMPGDWEIYVDVVTGGTAKRAVFPVQLEL